MAGQFPGFYDVQRPEEMPPGELRGLFTTDVDGRSRFRSIVPAYYPIPTDGPVGDLPRATGRHGFRPSLDFDIFVQGSPYLSSDAVLGVKRLIVADFPIVLHREQER